MQNAEQLVIACTQPLSEQLQAGWLLPLESLDIRPPAFLRLQAIGNLDACRTALRGIQINQIEVSLTGTDTSELIKAIALAKPHGAEVRARFLVTPSNWFWIEQVIQAATEAGAKLDLRILDYDGAAPLAALSANALGLVKDTVSDRQHHTRKQQPDSLGPDAYSMFVGELLGLLADRIEAQLEQTESTDEIVDEFVFPGLDHPYLSEAKQGAWFFRQVAGHSEYPIIHNWISELAEGQSAESLLRNQTWLRVLCHKIAWDQRSQQILQLMQTIYADPNEAKDLLEADAAFAKVVDLTPFGGPWEAALGLRSTPRTAPFEIPATTADSSVEAQLTILIPSYKHGIYIADTIQSALAQQGAPVKVLVVDDQSPDNTAEVARSIKDPRLEVRVNEQNLGLGNSVLQALETIDTPYVALLNSDDLLHPDRIAACLEVLNADDKTQVVTTGLSLIDHQGGELTPENTSLVMDGIQVFNWVHWYEQARVSTELSNQQVFEELLERNFLATSSNLTARTAWLRDRHRAFQNLKYCLDWQIFLEAALEGSLHHIPKPLAGYRLHASNTVWFEQGGRWAFFLEVNRVIADALKHYVRLHGTIDEALVYRVTSVVADQVAANREADGHALFLNAIMDGLAVDHMAGQSERIQEQFGSLRQVAADALKTRDEKQRKQEDLSEKSPLKKLLVQVQQKRLFDERTYLKKQKESLQRAIDHLKERASQTNRHHQTAIERLAANKESLQNKIHEIRANYEQRITDSNERHEVIHDNLEQLRQRLKDVEADLRERLAARLADIERLNRESANLRSQRDILSKQHDNLTSEHEALHSEHESLTSDHEHLTSDHEHLTSGYKNLTSEYGALQTEQKALQLKLDTVKQKTDREILHLTQRRNQLITEGSHLRSQMEKLRSSREFRAGNFLWNKLPLSYMSRRGKKWYNRLLDLKNRVSLWTGSKVKKSSAEGVAVVAACWQWPIYSHTFVYQEMIGLTHMGLDLKMFHWEQNDLAELQPAFAYLKDNRVQLKPDRQQHKKDKEYFEKTRPGRLNELLERLSSHTGKSVEELGEEILVLRGCTFARMAELANARYLHSYFFYDQSFMTFVAAWLLDIPRGVSCYADHMMDDFPFKVVALQLQMASVVVATSARIKTELVEIGGEECADKIVVKPNGVNGERFPAIDRGLRKPEDPFEVISISRLEPKKGLEFLIDAVAELKNRGRKIIVHLIGAVDTTIQASIDYGVEIEHQIKSLGLEEEVLLHGMKMHEEIAPIMRASRAFVAPYVELESGDKDGIPTAILEALASGLPIVTTDAGSILEIVQDGVQALVSPQRDSKAYTEALDKLITNPSLERQLAKQARKRFDENFDIKVTEQRLHERVANVLEQRSDAR